MPALIDVQQSAQESRLLGRVCAAMLSAVSAILATATDPTDARLAWVRGAWLTPGEAPKIPWWGARCLEHAVCSSALLRAAIDLDKDNPQVTDAQIQAFVNSYIDRCVTLRIGI